ncbi:hypothetical protein [Desulfogranum japonicum]|uniref:hypothetical protein n=1 Tax=Desulfogranum japonicum TaxID=231447 RepID=UPI0003FE750A|nr:hypothetical protein [Desulfogranum japonicum]
MKKETDTLGLTADTLKGKQSVRATFRLPEEVIRLLSIAAAQLGIKQKTLFDQLIEDQDVLDRVAREAEKYTSQAQSRQQKTYVLSRNSLISLERVSKQHEMPRDILVEVSIQRLQPVLDSEQKKQRRRRQALEEVERYCARGKQLLNEVGKLLGEDDPLYQHLESGVGQQEKHLQHMREIVRQGKSVEEL